MSREGVNEFGGHGRRDRRVNTGKFNHDLNEGQMTRDLNFKQRIAKQESGIMMAAKKDVVTIPPTSTIMGAARTMVGYGYRRLPVADPGTKRIEGICTVVDVIDFLGGGEKRMIIDKKYDGNMIMAINGPITEIMKENVVVSPDDSSLEDAVMLMIEKGIGGLPVVSEDGRIVGMLTERDIVHLFGESIINKSVKDLMSRGVRTANSGTTIEEAAKTMVSSGFRRLPIVADSILCGIVTATDIMRYLGSGEAFKKLVTGNISEALSVPVSEIMKGNVFTATPEDDLGATARMMYRNRIGCLPVISDSGLAGIITEHDILMSLKEGTG